MAAVHAGADEDSAEEPIGARRQGDVGMYEGVEEGSEGFTTENRRWRGRQEINGTQQEALVEGHFQGVEAERGSHVVVGIGVVHFVDAPEGGDGVEEAVGGVADQVQQEQRQKELDRKSVV